MGRPLGNRARGGSAHPIGQCLCRPEDGEASSKAAVIPASELTSFALSVWCRENRKLSKARRRSTPPADTEKIPAEVDSQGKEGPASDHRGIAV